MMKSDKSPPSSELSTRSSYQGQSLIKTGTYLHDGGIPLGNSKPNEHAHAQLRIYICIFRPRLLRLLCFMMRLSRETVASATSTLRDKACKMGREREPVRDGVSC